MRFAIFFLMLSGLASAQLVAPNAVPDGTIPVILLNGYQYGCTSDSGLAGNFGSIDKVLQAAKLVSVYFDNCTVGGTPSIETLGAGFGKFLAALRYVNGSPVPQVDVVGHSMGGLIIRAYLAGMQDATGGKPATFAPPVTPGIRKAIFLATPNFGTAVASFFGADKQTQEMSPGSQFLFDLNTWNQGTDDLRGVDALAIAGKGGTGLESGQKGFDDGVVQLTSSSIGFAQSGRTRLVPDCHTGSALVFTFGVCAPATPAINYVNDSSNLVGQIMLSFLTGTNAWASLGDPIEKDTLGSVASGVLVGAQDLNGVPLTISSATAATTTLAVNAVAFKEALPAATALPLQLKLVGSTTFSSTLNLAPAASTAIIAKPGPSITGIVPAGIAQFSRDVAPGAFVTVYGSGLASTTAQQTQPYPAKLSDVEVFVNGAAAPIQYVGPNQINFIFPNLAPGIALLSVKNALGQQTVNVMTAVAVPSIFTFTGVASGPAAAENAVTFAIIDANRPIHAGEYVALFLTGLGQTPAATTTVSVGGQSCAGQYFFAGHVPSVVGLDQVNCQIPAGVTGAAVPVVVTTNGRASNTATLNIQ